MKRTRTLCISDLDGTLLNRSSRLSEATINTLNRLMADGMIFTYATARSLVTASEVTADLKGLAPAIIYNGAFTVVTTTGQRLRACHFSDEASSHILNTLLSHGIYPTVFADIDRRERMSYCPALLSEGMRAFRSSRANDPRTRAVDTPDALYQGEIFHFSCIDTPEKLFPAYQTLRQNHTCLFYKDPQSGAQWLEISPPGATKAHAALALKEMLGCDRLVCFGDGINDLPLFAVADECYAVANAAEEVKATATAVIGSHDEDGVAAWLSANFDK